MNIITKLNKIEISQGGKDIRYLPEFLNQRERMEDFTGEVQEAV